MFLKRKEKQRDGRDKNTVINRNYIESGEYRKKFDKITDDKDINRLLYNCAKEMLFHRSGTLYEDMYWIDPVSKRIVISETNQLIPRKIVYSKSTKKSIKKYRGLITIHNHPSSFPPSIEDLNSNCLNNYAIGIVCCHDGKVYKYSASMMSSVVKCNMRIDKFINLGYSDFSAQLLCLNELLKKKIIFWEEV